ncbi:MAG TPA: metallophosphoesterase [Chthoniobacteraceae bacterium]|nr:metallophosphoesterase [Chthoniobacteraceae bacterium]
MAILRRGTRSRAGLWLRLAVLISCVCGWSAQAETRFIQLTDPHLFDRPPEERAENEDGLKWCIEEINQRVAAGAKYDFVIVTGDLGLEKLKDPATLAAAVKDFGALIQPSAVDKWFFVPGNNDLINETPKTVSLYREFMAALGNAGTGKTVVDLSRADGSYDQDKCRFIGFDNASFKSNNSAANAREFEAEQLARIDEVLARLKAPGFENAYVFYHVPDCDDPYSAAMADDRAKTREELAAAPYQYSAWTVTPKVREQWQKVVNDPRVKGLFAGHFHYFSRDAYEWDRSNPALLNGVSPKLYVTPPVAGKYQRGYIPQARGFREVAIVDGKFTKNKIVWRDLPLPPKAPSAAPAKQP